MYYHTASLDLSDLYLSTHMQTFFHPYMRGTDHPGDLALHRMPHTSILIRALPQSTSLFPTVDSVTQHMVQQCSEFLEISFLVYERVGTVNDVVWPCASSKSLINDHSRPSHRHAFNGV